MVSLVDSFNAFSTIACEATVTAWGRFWCWISGLFVSTFTLVLTYLLAIAVHIRELSSPACMCTTQTLLPFRGQARKFHPDVNKDPGADQKFKDVSNAYEVLSDDQKRSIYDR